MQNEMKSTKVWRSFLQVDNVFCPYCNFQEDAPDELYQVDNEDDFEIIHKCTMCEKKYKINWIKED